MLVLFILLQLGFWSFGEGFEGGVVLKDLGEKYFLSIKEKANLPAHGACWHNALKLLQNNCNQLNDHEHSLLALRLANCFLEDSGHDTYDCHLSETESDRRKCINQMSDRAFGVYNEFYTHTTHMCFYLNHELWQIETDRTIKVLYQASSKMREQLHEASKVQDSMLVSQKESLKLQSELIDNGKKLEGIIETSAETVSTMVSDFKEVSRDQQVLLHEIFSYMRAFQDWIIGEVSWFQSILYFTVTCIFFGLLSSSKRTADARAALFAILSVNVVVERMLVQYRRSSKEGSQDDAMEVIYFTWWIRKVALAVCFGVLLYSYYSYKDEKVECFKVLRQIERQLHVLKDNPLPHRSSPRLAMKRLNKASVKEIVN